MLSTESECWDIEAKKFRAWKMGTVKAKGKKDPWTEYSGDVPKKPNWFVYAAVGKERGPVEVARGWNGPTEMFDAMNFCTAGYIYQPETPMEDCPRITSKTLP